MLTGGGRGSSHCLRKKNIKISGETFKKLNKNLKISVLQTVYMLYLQFIPDICFGGDKCRNFDDFAHLVLKIISAEIYLRLIIQLQRAEYLSLPNFFTFSLQQLQVVGIQLNLIKYKFYPSVVLKISIMNADSDRLKFKLAEQ